MTDEARDGDVIRGFNIIKGIDNMADLFFFQLDDESRKRGNRFESHDHQVAE